jgi:hypothetical protein
VEACHAFTNVMGAVNVTHFKPLNRQMWAHYQVGARPNQRLTFLGVPPVEPLPFPSDGPQNVDYVDRSTAGEFGMSDSGLALSRMFWRGDLHHTCRMLDDHPEALYALRDDCVRGAKSGGDLEHLALADLRAWI